jgi:hypothetical protein
LSTDKYEVLKDKVGIVDWNEEDYAVKLLRAIKHCQPLYRFLRQIVRTPIIPPQEFDASSHHDLLALESILNN